MRFKLDENLPTELADFLNLAGNDAETVIDEGLVGESNEKIAKVCIDEKRALVTLDMDFSNVRAYPPENFSGLIVLRLRRQDKRHLLAKFEQLLDLFQTERLVGLLWIVEDDRIRVRE